MKKIKVLEKEISLYSQNEEDYICITDIAKYKNSETTGLVKLPPPEVVACFNCPGRHPVFSA